MLAAGRLIALFAFLATIPSVSNACSCMGGTLDARFAASDNVFTARITGGTLADGKRPDEPATIATFETTDVFKGTIPFKHLRSHVGGASCGISLAVGYEYLVFAPDDGRIGLCSGIGIVSPEPERPSNHSVEYARILRAWKAGRTPDLSEPWTFLDADGVCDLSTIFPTNVDGRTSMLSIAFHHEDRAESLDEPARERSRPGHAELRIDDVASRIDDSNRPPLSVRVGDREYAANWVKDSYRVQYILMGEGVIELTRELARVDRVVISGTHPDHDRFEGIARTTHIGTGAADMLDCMRSRD